MFVRFECVICIRKLLFFCIIYRDIWHDTAAHFTRQTWCYHILSPADYSVVYIRRWKILIYGDRYVSIVIRTILLGCVKRTWNRHWLIRLASGKSENPVCFKYDEYFKLLNHISPFWSNVFEVLIYKKCKVITHSVVS